MKLLQETHDRLDVLNKFILFAYFSLFAHLVRRIKVVELTFCNTSKHSQKNRMSKNVAEIIATLNETQFVNLPRSAIAAKHLLALANALKTNTSVKCIDLNFNAIGDEGVSELSAAL